MKSIITIFILLVLRSSLIEAIYANVSENVIENDDWTEVDGIWGPLLEEWTLGGNRSVYQDFSKPDQVHGSEKIDTSMS